MNMNNRIRMSRGDRALMVFIYAILIILGCLFLYPILYVFSASFSDSRAVGGGQLILLPIRPSLDGYAFVFQYREVWIGYRNTLFYAVVGTLCNLAVTLPCAYALSRRDMQGRNVLMSIMLFTMYFSGGLIPIYLNMRDFGLLNTRAAIIVSGLMSVYNVIIARTFFSNTIPWELQEAAKIDGCSDFRLFLTIVLPLSKAIVMVLTIYYAVGHWNSFFREMIYLNDRSKFPLQLFLREILVQSKMAETAISSGEAYSAEDMLLLMRQADTANMLKYCFIVVSTLPMLLIYPFLQRFFEKGVMIGSVKG